MTKLYRVEITCYVVAADLEAAGRLAVAEYQAGRAVETTEVVYTVVDYDWPDVIPTGEEEGRTCGEIARAQRVQMALAMIPKPAADQSTPA